ncbi:hypothetical protein JCM19233_6154 [Vibrio astriarenae]|nr:hypothetical protein JCM19233_6154 [Vibrio sp. C7]
MYIKNFVNDAGELMAKIPKNLEKEFLEKFPNAKFNGLGRFWVVPAGDVELAQQWIDEIQGR